MPIYEYRCRSCGEKFEKLVRYANSGERVICLRCRSEAVKKQFSIFGRMGSSLGGTSWSSGST